MKSFHPLFISVALVFSPSVLTSSDAYACLAPSSETTIFFDEQDLKAGIDGPAAADVTITALSLPFVAVARVNKTIKGSIDGDTIFVTVAPTDCTRGFGVGASGIVVGSLQRNAQGELVLAATEESNSERHARRKSHSMQAR